MQTINISDFRANLLKYLEVAHSGQTISVTSNGRLLATISPPVIPKDHAKAQLKALAANAEVTDVITPVNADWDTLL